MLDIEIWCDNCDKKHTMKFKLVSEIPDMICPICKSNKIWICKVIDNDTNDNEIILGKGGCRQR